MGDDSNTEQLKLLPAEEREMEQLELLVLETTDRKLKTYAKRNSQIEIVKKRLNVIGSLISLNVC